MTILLRVFLQGIRQEVKQLMASPSPIKKSLRHIKAGVMLAANAVMSAFVYVRSATLSSLTRICSYRRRIRAGLMVLAKPILIVAGAIFLSPLMPDMLEIFSSESDRTLKQTQNVTPIGWIRIGIVNNTLSSSSVVEQLFQTSDSRSAPSIDSPVVPSRGAVVTVKNPVNLRKNRPKIYNNSDLPPKIGLLKPEEKLIILKVQRLVNPSSQIEVWAEVGRYKEKYGSGE
ncbi:MAG: hypothetical protein DSM106950_19810 [Stigonema ocellatum SAG 48.90 = DSM 106950]|nr:hypothetical protein [Stigonema ocellatum SAG 48.90 = DSM 106950]